MPPTQPTGWVGWHAAIPICSFCGRSGSDRRLDHKSRMRREPPVRIREGLGVKLPQATRLLVFGDDNVVLVEVRRQAAGLLARPRLRLHPSKCVVFPTAAGI